MNFGHSTMLLGVVTLAFLPASALRGEGDDVATLVLQLNSSEAMVARRAEAELVRMGKPAIANFSNATVLSLPPAAGQQAVAAAAKLRSLKLFRTRNETLRAADLEPLRRHPHVKYVGVFDGTT